MDQRRDQRFLLAVGEKKNFFFHFEANILKKYDLEIFTLYGECTMLENHKG